jgi:flagellar motor switch protein FliM
VIEPIMDDISARTWSQVGRNRSDHQWSTLVADRIADAQLEAIAMLAETTMTVSDLRNLEVGDVIMTDKSAKSPVMLYIESVPKFFADIGCHRNHRALRIRRRVSPGDRL